MTRAEKIISRIDELTLSKPKAAALAAAGAGGLTALYHGARKSAHAMKNAIEGSDTGQMIKKTAADRAKKAAGIE